MTLGLPLPVEGWKCTPDSCTRPGNVAGVGGEILVLLCGNAARQVRFSRTMVDESDVGRLPPKDVAQLAQAGFFVVGNIRSDTTHSTLAITNGLATDGWISGDSHQQTGARFTQSSTFVAPDGRSRSWTSIIGSEDTALGKATVVHLRLESAAQPCSSGL